MAGQESLGTAVLQLTVDDSALRKGVADAKKFIGSELGQAFSGGTTSKANKQESDRFRATRVITRRLGDELNKLEARGISVTKQFEQLSKAATAADKGLIELARTRNKGVADFIKLENRAYTATNNRVRLSQAQKAKERQGRISSGLIGGAFPLLFGQGPGAAAGGAIGGFAGGGPLGFALSLVGTIVGQTADQLIQKLTTLGSALKNPVANVNALSASASLSSSYLAKYTQSLIATGREAEAAALIQLDLAQVFGDTSDLTKLADAQDELGRNTERLTIALSRLAAGPLAKFLGAINSAIKLGPKTGPDGLPNFANETQRISRQRSISETFTRFANLTSFNRGISTPLRFIGQALDPGAPGEDLDKFLKSIQAYKDARERINKLRFVEIELTKNISVEDRKILREAAAQVKYQEAIVAAGKDKVKISQAEHDLELDKAKIQQEFLADSFRGNQIALQQANTLFEAYQRLRAAQEAQQLTPKYGQTQSSRVVEVVQGQINGAIAGEERAFFQLSQAYAQLANARERGTLADIAAAETAVAAARADLETAGINVKIAIQEGANTLLENAESAAKRFRDATRSLRDLQIGNLRFLPAAQREDIVRKEIEKALPEARSRGVTLRGIEDVFSFNRFIEQESSALQERSDAQRNLADANDSLKSEIVTQTGALNTLTERLSQLIDKSWSVYVEVPGQNGAAPLNMSNQLN